MFRPVSFRIVLLMFGLFLAAAAGASAETLYVSPQGNDHWSGRLFGPNSSRSNGPLASLNEARNRIRDLKRRGPLKSAIRVILRGGIYPAPLVLEPQDSGASGAPIVYEAAKGETAVISGARRIENWSLGAGGVWSADLPDVRGGKWRFDQLWTNGGRIRRASLPEDGLGHILSVSQTPLAGNGPDKVRAAIRVDPAELRPLASLAPDEIKDVTLTIFHNWDNTIHKIDSLDIKNGVIYADLPYLKPSVDSSAEYRLSNVRSALVSSGEWALSSSGEIFYKPLSGRTPQNTAVFAPVSQSLLELKGDLRNGKRVENIVFKNIAFEYCGTNDPPGGFTPDQAAESVGSAILANGARNVSFENCEISHIGEYAIWFRTGCDHDSVRRCYIHDLGAGGARIGETAGWEPQNRRTSFIVLDNNIIRDGGHLYPCAAGVLIGQSDHDAVTHNEIAQFFYTGVSVGWTWGYGPSAAFANRIAYNRIHLLGYHVMSDMGGIYALGISPGTRVDHNVVHDVFAAKYGGWGLYADEGGSGIVFDSNLCYHNSSTGFHQHYGEGNLVENNVFALNRDGEITRTRIEDHISFIFTRNIVYSRTYAVFLGSWNNEVNAVLENNLYCCAQNAPLDMKGQDKFSLIADPLFLDPRKFDFRLAPNSPALKIGFVPFDASEAGVYGDKQWKALADESKNKPFNENAGDAIETP